MSDWSSKLCYMYSFILLQIAMNIPSFRLKIGLYRLRGSTLGSHINIASQVYFDEYYPELITIGNHVDLGHGVIILCHDSIEKKFLGKNISTGHVLIEDDVYIGAGTIILPGVTIGERSIIGAGALVNKDIPPDSVAVGIPARVIESTDEFLLKRGNIIAPPFKKNKY